jgi:hypothetical protein
MALRIACDLDGTVADMESALQREAERLFGPDVDVRARGHVVAQTEEADGSPDDGASLEGETAVDDGGAGEPAPEGTGASERPGATTKPGTPSERPIRTALTRAQMKQLWAHVRGIEDFWMTLAEIEPGAVSRFAAAASQHAWEVIFLTQRPATKGKTAQWQSQRWLDAHGFGFPAVYVMKGSRGKVADALALDAVLDDRAENCLDVTIDSKARSFLIWRDEPSSVPAAAAGLGITVVYSFAEALNHLRQMTEKSAKSPGLVSRLRAAIGI